MLDVAVVDDDPHYPVLLGLALEREPDVRLVGHATTADEAIGLMSERAADLVLVDASLPGAVAASPRLHTSAPGARLVLTSSLPARSIASTVAAAKAVGSLAKDIPMPRVADAIREVAALSTAAERAVRTAAAALAKERSSPRRSRELVRSALVGWCDPPSLAVVELLISELVANGVEHAQTEVDVRVAVGPSAVRVEVTDRNPTLPVMRSPGLDSPSGRGLRIVDNAALRWGVQARRTGKCVWFEVPRVQEATAE